MVIMACRNRAKCIEKRRDITLSTKNKQVFCRQLDISNFESIKNFVEKIESGKIPSPLSRRHDILVLGQFRLERIDGLVHNAGVMDPTRIVHKSVNSIVVSD